MIEFREFDENDWQAFNGASEAEDGRQPIIGELELDDGNYVTVIADGTGIEVIITAPSDAGEQTIFQRHEDAYDVNVAIAKALTSFTPAGLEAFGFYCINEH